jgi:glycosyltransferase involved in cell wall biosynthesis
VVVYCCDFLRQQQAPLLQPPQTDVIFYGVEDPSAERTGEGVPLRETTGASEGKLILWAGHLIERKDPLLAVEAMPLLPPAHLVFLGDGPLRAEIAERSAQLGVESRVHLLGNVDRPRVLRYLAEADLLLITSRAEGIPLVLFEAMMAETPVVAAPISGIPEMVTDGETGFLIDERTGEATAAAICRAVEGADTPALVQRAREKVLARCSWEAMARRYAPWYGIEPPPEAPTS